MKITTLIVLISFITSQAIMAQEVSFPLTSGDEWEYGVFIPNAPWRVTADTLMPNAITYRIVTSQGYPAEDSTFFWFYLRQEGNRVYRYDTYNLQEILFFDFDVALDSVFSTFPYGSGQGSVRLTSRNVETIFGVARDHWVFYYDPIDHVIDEEIIFHVTDSLGITGTYNIFGSGGSIVGARIAGVAFGTLTHVDLSQRPILTGFQLHNPYPNPFNGRVSILLSFTPHEVVTIKVFDILGREITQLFSGAITPGDHQFHWEPSSFATGIYVVRAESQSAVQVKSLSLTR